jgi:multiple sugar transport system substrate-binding protein
MAAHVEKLRPWLLAICAIGMIGTIAGCGSASGSSGPGSLSGTISVAYSSTFVFDANSAAAQWWSGIQKEFEQQYPKAKLQLIPVQGTDVDLQNKLALDYRSSSTAPDVAQINLAALGGFAQAGDLLSLNNYAQADHAWWSDFPANVQNEGTIGGQLYGVSAGDNDLGIMYNREILAKAGIKLPWRPHTWADIVAAARQVKARVPGVVPFWTGGGTSQGVLMMSRGPNSLLYASSTPMIQDPSSGKWVVDSPGLRELFGFYKTIYGEGLGPNPSVIFSKTATGWRLPAMAQGKLAISIAENWWAGSWKMPGTGSHFPQYATVTAAVPIPTVNGEAPGSATEMTGFGYVVSKYTQHAQLAWDLVKLMENKQNAIGIANGAGFVPPRQSLRSDPGYVDFAPPMNAQFAQYFNHAKPLPTGADYLVWAQGMEQATGQLIQNPTGTSVDDAIRTVETTVKNQLGANAAEVIR